MSKLQDDENKVQEKIGYKFDNLDLLYQAFTRKSYSVEFGGENNEVLEFIGDSVLNFYVTKIISDRFGFMKSKSQYYDEDRDYDEYCIIANKNEADFSELRKQIVSNNNLSKQINHLGLAKYLFMGDSDWDNEVYKQEKVKADLFEAIIGAVAIDCNWNFSYISTVIETMLNIEIFLKNVDTQEKRPDKFKIENAINTLKELAEHGICSKPEYEIKEERVYIDGELYWECTCYVSWNWSISCTGYGKSKKIAKHRAAYEVLCEHYDLPNEYEEN